MSEEQKEYITYAVAVSFFAVGATGVVAAVYMYFS